MRLSSMEVRHDPAAPYQLDQIIPADNVVAVLQQMNQQVKDLWLHRNQFRRHGATREGRGVENMIFEVKFHVAKSHLE